MEQRSDQRRRRAFAAVAVGGVCLALAAILGVLGFLAWRSQPSLERALLFGLPPMLLAWLGIAIGAEAFRRPED